jgi:putative transposase
MMMWHDQGFQHLIGGRGIMPGLLPRPLRLEEGERLELQQLVDRHKTPQQIALRAQIILRADAEQTHRQIARGLNISRDMARHWRERWLDTAGRGQSVLERLQDAERPGTPAKFTPDSLPDTFTRRQRHSLPAH